MLDKQAILEFFRQNPRPLSFRELVRRMGLSSPASRSLKKAIRAMVASGDLVRTKRGMYGPPEEMELLTGYFEAHRDGYGFVIPEKPGLRDVFIPARATLSAMGGDRVAAAVMSARRRSGRIVRILERVHKRIAGKVDMTGGSVFVRPRSSSVSFDIHVPAEAASGARDGQPVLVEIESYPSEKRPAAGRIVKLLEEPADASADVQSIIDEFNLPRRFSSAVSAEAREVSLKPTGRRTDLRALNTVTIDGETAKDFDDAVSIRRETRGYTLWVHIADVSHYVTDGTRLDAEARQRATSVYFPGSVIPMLPKALSEDVCSLKPRVDRAAFTVEMTFDSMGNYGKATFYPSLINSNERMTYTSVAKIVVDGDTDERARYASLVDDFDTMDELAHLIRKRRIARGSLDFDLPEPEVLLDMQGNPESIVKSVRNFAHMIIEEFMIAANEAVAMHLESRGYPCMFRIHEEPDEAKLQEVMRVAGSRAGRSRAAEPKSIRALSAKVKGTPMEEAVNYMILRSMKQARYSELNVGHFGLASESYCHFTSPIRRYPDLVVHRILKEAITANGLSDKSAKAYAGMLPDAAFHCSRRERLSMEAEREVMDAMKVWFMRDKLGEEFPGIITGITPRGMRVRLEEFYVEGFISLSDLTDDYYLYDEDSLALRGKHSRKAYTFGQRLRVSVDRVDMVERRVIFGIPGTDPEAARWRRPRGSGRAR